MRLLFVADLHYSLKQFDWVVAQASSFDVVAIGGDLLDLASAVDPDIQITVVERYIAILQSKTRVLITSGNHDGDGRNAADESIASWIRELRGSQLHADGRSLRLGDVKLTLCPWWDGEMSRAEIDVQLRAEAEDAQGTWVWIHHAPPEGALTCWTGKRAAGDAALSAWIKQHKPFAVLSGHIHNAPFYPEGSWVDCLDGTWVFNPGRQIGPQPTAIVIDFDAMQAVWISLEGESVRGLGLGDR